MTTPAIVSMLTVTHTDGPASNTRSHTKRTLLILPPPHTQTFHLTFLWMQLKHPSPLQHTDWKHYCKCRGSTHSVKVFLNIYLMGKVPQHETDIFTHVKGLLYKYVMDSEKQFLTLIIPKSWKYTVLVKAHDKLGHQGNSHNFCLIKRQYYWKGMNKDIKEIHCKLHTLPKRESQSSTLPFADDRNTR